MGIITKEVEVRLNPRNVEYYKSLGYEIPMRKSTKKYPQKGKEFVCDMSKTITVKIEDLPYGSSITVKVLCDYCNETICYPDYKAYYQRVKKFGKYACHNCGSIHFKESCVQNLGVDNPSKSFEIRERVRNTTLERYGTLYPMQNEEIKNKSQQSVYTRYGVINVSQSEEIKQRKRHSNIEHYGTINVASAKEVREKTLNTLRSKYGEDNILSSLQIPEVREKAKQTSMARYGVLHPMQSPEIRAKVNETLCQNGKIRTSKQQLYLYNLYRAAVNENIEINYPISCYPVDICFTEERLVIEYDGGGHSLGVVLGKLTQEDFNQKEIIRSFVLKREGYKQIHIISKKDFLPSDQVLLNILFKSKLYFQTYPHHSWINFDIDNSMVLNAENKDIGGECFDYGELRTITEYSQINQQSV